MDIGQQRSFPKTNSGKSPPTCFTPSIAGTSDTGKNFFNPYFRRDVKKFHSHVLAKNGSVQVKPSNLFFNESLDIWKNCYIAVVDSTVKLDLLQFVVLL